MGDLQPKDNSIIVVWKQPVYWTSYSEAKYCFTGNYLLKCKIQECVTLYICFVISSVLGTEGRISLSLGSLSVGY